MCIVSRWMKEAGFRYAKHKKCYYVDRHEDKDVIEDRVTYVKNFFKHEINEHCWMQMPRWKYSNFKLKKVINHILIKNEGSSIAQVLDDKMAKYIENERVYFYTADNGTDMVELHVDDIYQYNNDNL